MEQIRINRGARALQARRRAERRTPSLEALSYASGDAPDIDEDLLARIDALLDLDS